MSHSTLAKNSITNPLRGEQRIAVAHSGSSTMKVSTRMMLVNWWF